MLLRHGLRCWLLVLSVIGGLVAPASGQAPGKSYSKAAQPASAPAKRLIRRDIPLDVQARQAAQRAIPYIQKNGIAWINERNCLSCRLRGSKPSIFAALIWFEGAAPCCSAARPPHT